MRTCNTISIFCVWSLQGVIIDGWLCKFLRHCVSFSQSYDSLIFSCSVYEETHLLMLCCRTELEVTGLFAQVDKQMTYFTLTFCRFVSESVNLDKR